MGMRTRTPQRGEESNNVNVIDFLTITQSSSNASTSSATTGGSGVGRRGNSRSPSRTSSFRTSSGVNGTVTSSSATTLDKNNNADNNGHHNGGAVISSPLLMSSSTHHTATTPRMRSPSPFVVRRSSLATTTTTKYSPTKRNSIKNSSSSDRRLTSLFLGLIFISVLATMVFTMMLMDNTTGASLPDKRHAFVTVPSSSSEKKKKRTTSPPITTKTIRKDNNNHGGGVRKGNISSHRHSKIRGGGYENKNAAAEQTTRVPINHGNVPDDTKNVVVDNDDDDGAHDRVTSNDNEKEQDDNVLSRHDDAMTDTQRDDLESDDKDDDESVAMDKSNDSEGSESNDKEQDVDTVNDTELDSNTNDAAALQDDSDANGEDEQDADERATEWDDEDASTKVDKSNDDKEESTAFDPSGDDHGLEGKRINDEEREIDTLNEAQLDLINDVSLQDADANGDDQEDSIEDREDFADAPKEHRGEEFETETVDEDASIEIDNHEDAASVPSDDNVLGMDRHGNDEIQPDTNDYREPIVVPDFERDDTATTVKPGQYPRISFYEVDDPPPVRTHRMLPDDEMLHAPPGFEAVDQDRPKADYTKGDCVPMHDWQTKSFPNCNLLHEYDMKAAGPGVYKNNSNVVLEDTLSLLGQGWFRHSWKLDTGATDESVVLKTLRLEREFYDEFYDLHRRDAVAMERLTHSPFIMNVYGFCGQSALNELAEFGKGVFATLEKVDRKMRGREDSISYTLKLQLGASVAVGVAHIHEIDDHDRPSMVHYDLNPRNVAMVGGGKPKINDFNIAEFVHWNPKTNETCGFPSRLHEPWWRAPEEVSLNPDNGTGLTSAVDVYALGSILHHILTTHSPRGKMKKERAEEVREKVMRGEPPVLDERYTKSKNPVIVAFRKAMELCFVADPKKRGTARQVADVLLAALMDVRRKRKAKMKGQ